MSFFPSFGRMQSGFDDRKISKVRYFFKIYNEWDELIYTSRDMTHEFNDPLKPGQFTIPHLSNWRVVVGELQKEYKNSRDKLNPSRFKVKIFPNAIILSDNSVVE